MQVPIILTTKFILLKQVYEVKALRCQELRPDDNNALINK